MLNPTFSRVIHSGAWVVSDIVICSRDLQKQLQENLISYLSVLEGVDLDDDKGFVLNDVCQIVVDTFRASACNCSQLDDDLIESGWTCYNCYESGRD